MRGRHWAKRRVCELRAWRTQARVQEKCQVVAREFRLTEREAEVMALLAKGRTRARIQEELYLSSGTVATHARHIYQKVGVHSKQELLDAIESAGERSAR